MTADSVPAPMVPAAMPTTPGSVIEATIEGLAEKRLWMLDFGGYWTNNYAGTAMKPVTSAQLTLVRVLFDAATPAVSVDKLRETFLVNGNGQSDAVYLAARALVDAADTPRDQPHDCDSGGEDGYCSNCDPALASTIPAAPPERCLACLHPFDGHEGLTCAEMEAKHGVVQPEPLCRCGHDKAAHEYEYSPVKGHCSHGGTNGVPECRCARFVARVPVSDEAEGLAEHEKNLRNLWRELAEKRIAQGVDWPHIVLTLFADIDRLRAARGEDA